ncbi:MAG: pyridoxamine 5'-phosphate oxidase family protein [Candidatus Thorarchaeota archaeon]
MIFLRAERVARIATVSPIDKSPHVVPVCYVFDGSCFYTTLSMRSRRVKNLKPGSHVSLVVDRYEEEHGRWLTLRGIMVNGVAELLRFKQHKSEFTKGWTLLLQRYPQYMQWARNDLTPRNADDRAMLQIKPIEKASWGFEH